MVAADDVVLHARAIDVLKRAGVTDLISLSACGSFKEELPPGTFLKWTGQYELLEQMQGRMRVLVPLTLLLTVTAKEKSGQRAAEVANGFAKTYIDLKSEAVWAGRALRPSTVLVARSGPVVQIRDGDGEIGRAHV